MKFSAWVFLFLALAATFVQAEDDEEYTQDETAPVDEEYEDEDAHEVSTSYLLPEYDDKRFPVGKEVTILVDVSNDGQDVFNITRIGCFLHSPFDLNYYIQNFTVKELSGVAAPSAQISLEYKFTPDPKLEPLEFWLSGFVEYTMEGSDEAYQQTFINTTVHLYEDKTGIDFANMFTSLLMLVTVGAGGYGAFLVAASKAGIKKKKKYVAKAAPTAEAEDWDVSTYKQNSKSRVAGKRPKKASKPVSK